MKNNQQQNKITEQIDQCRIEVSCPAWAEPSAFSYLRMMFREHT